MKRCLACSSPIHGEEWMCESCGWSPQNSERVVMFADHISGPDEGYDPVWYEELASLEEGNFWFKARNNLIRWMAERHCPTQGRYLELGCGTGYVLRMLRQAFPGWSMGASEAHVEGLGFAGQRVSEDVALYQMDARAIPFRDEFDVIGAFDVVEHIKEDEEVLAEIHNALRPGGVFLMSVPQHMFLWSRFDEIGCHFRRYSMKELKEKLNAAGFEVAESTSFNAVLLPLMMLSRVLKRDNDKDVDVLDELRISSFVNSVLSGLLSIELLTIKLGLRWPFGGSRIVVAKKKG